MSDSDSDSDSGAGWLSSVSDTDTDLSLWRILGTVTAIWAVLHMDRTVAIAGTVAANSELPYQLAMWLAWATIAFGGVALAIIGALAGVIGLIVLIAILGSLFRLFAMGWNKYHGYD